jgi:hemolysin activation/secretion protein
MLAIVGAALPLLPGLPIAIAQQNPQNMGETPPSDGQEAGAEPAQAQAAPTYHISTFNVAHRGAEPPDVTVDDLMDVPLRLGVTNDIIGPVAGGVELLETSLAGLSSDEPREYSALGLRSIVGQLFDYITSERGLMAVAVAPSREQIDLITGHDRRVAEGQALPEDPSLTIEVMIGRVGQVRSIGSGNRIPTGANIGHKVHEPLRRRSPFQPDGEGDAAPRDILRRPALDNYLHRLNRHPGRRVDAALSRGPSEGEVSLDYLVAENKPWYAYFQLSNTGTESTGDWRQRFGFAHNQLTNADDILTIDYSTVEFRDTHALLAAYQRPINERLRFRVRGLYSEFVASDLGLAGEDLSGDEWSIGGDLVYTIIQDGPLFFDLVGGIDYRDISSTNEFYLFDPFTGAPGPFTGEEDFLIPHVGLEVERLTDTAQTRADLDLSFGIDDANEEDLFGLGRGDPITGAGAPDEHFFIVGAGFEHAFYLEPVLAPQRWRDLSDPSWSTLAHELALGLRSQFTTNRLVPQMQSVTGGLYTVRGYEEAQVAGDSSVLATAEYRLHLPRLLGINDASKTPMFGRPFRFTPDTPYGRADWDLQVKAFVDAARVMHNDPIPGEVNETLVGAGLGAELSLLNNFSARLDWAMALQDAGRTDAGDHRLHFVLTLLY